MEGGSITGPDQAAAYLLVLASPIYCLFISLPAFSIYHLLTKSSSFAGSIFFRSRLKGKQRHDEKEFGL